MLLAKSDLGEFWQRDLRPYRHYLPVLADFSNLEAQIKWAERRPQKMHAIIAHNRAYAAKYLTSHSQLCYLALLLDRFRKLSVTQPTVTSTATGARDVPLPSALKRNAVVHALGKLPRSWGVHG